MTRLLLVFGMASVLLRAGTAENVLIVVNTNSALSKNIGEYYARRRSVPQSRVCKIATVEQETISRQVYDKDIEPGVARCLTEGKLTEKILYIVTTQGVPLRIQGSGGRSGDASSVDSELALLYPRMKGTPLGVPGAIPNPFYGKVDAEFRRPEFPIFLVTRLAAYDFNGVKALIDRALNARNLGMFVLDGSDNNSGPGNEWMKDAAIRLPTERTIFDQTSGKVLYDLANVIAYVSWGSNDKKHTRRSPGFKWLPGAIVINYVSNDGRTFITPPKGWNITTHWNDPKTWYAGAPQSLTADYLEEGATGASGHVWEPYLSFVPHPDKVLPAYYSGRNLAESYYLGMPGLSWQNIIIGDPLCSLGKPR